MIDISICCIITILCYFIIGLFICKQYVDIVNDRERKSGKKKKVNKNRRLFKRLSIILLYPIYAIIILAGLIIELLTEDEPFE